MGIDYDSFMNDENKQKILNTIRSVDPNFPDKDLMPDLILKNIVGWDSMNSVNFLMALEEEFDLKPGVIDFNGEEKMSNVVEALQCQVQ